MGGIEAGQVGHAVQVRRLIDQGYLVKVASTGFLEGAQHATAYAAIAIDGQTDRKIHENARQTAVIPNPVLYYGYRPAWPARAASVAYGKIDDDLARFAGYILDADLFAIEIVDLAQ